MSSEILTSVGRVDPFNLTNDKLPVLLFTHALSLLNRYTGHTKRPYSVAEHSINLARSTEVKRAGLVRAALLHDFGEALINDLARPIKTRLPEYVKIEAEVHERIFDWWQEPMDNYRALAEFDYRICINEMAALFSTPHRLEGEPLDTKISLHDVSWVSIRTTFQNLCAENGIN